jgi:hypothetical protein
MPWTGSRFSANTARALMLCASVEEAMGRILVGSAPQFFGGRYIRAVSPSSLRPMDKKEEGQAAFSAYVMMFRSPPGGAIDPTGALEPTLGTKITNSTAFQVLTSNGSTATWASIPPPSGLPTSFSVSAHWGDSAATFALPANATTTLPIDAIDANGAGFWNLTGGNTLVNNGGPSILNYVTVSINVKNVGAASVPGKLVISLSGTQIASQSFATSSTSGAITTVTASTMATVFSAQSLTAAVICGSDAYQILGNGSGGIAPWTSIQWNVIGLTSPGAL